MADQKITELTELAETPATDDLLAIVDTSATATKKITKANLVGAPNLIFATSYLGGDTGWTKSTSGSGAVTFGTSYCRTYTDTTASSEAYVMTLRTVYLSYGFSYPITGGAFLYFIKGAASGNGTARYHWCTSNGGSDTSHHIGIKMIKTSGTAKLYATTGNGSNEETTELDADYSSVEDVFGFEWKDGEVKFYQDGSLVATHDTYLPSGSMGYTFSQRANENTEGTAVGIDAYASSINCPIY